MTPGLRLQHHWRHKHAGWLNLEGKDLEGITVVLMKTSLSGSCGMMSRNCKIDEL